jgi:hypothetical protein
MLERNGMGNPPAQIIYQIPKKGVSWGLELGMPKSETNCLTTRPFK